MDHWVRFANKHSYVEYFALYFFSLQIPLARSKSWLCFNRLRCWLAFEQVALAAFRKTKKLALLGLLLQPHPDPAPCVVIEEADPGLLEG
jgi:hypothetical protein